MRTILQYLNNNLFTEKFLFDDFRGITYKELEHICSTFKVLEKNNSPYIAMLKSKYRNYLKK